MFAHFNIVYLIPLVLFLGLLVDYFLLKRRLERRIREVEEQRKQDRIKYFTELYNLDIESKESKNEVS